MRARYEFSLYAIADPGAGVDASLALMGSLGWEVRGIAAAPGGGVIVALQRPLDEALPLPDAPTLAATLEEPLSVPVVEDIH